MNIITIALCIIGVATIAGCIFGNYLSKLEESDVSEASLSIGEGTNKE